MTDPSGTTTWAYDDADRVTAIATAAGTVTYGWDDGGRRIHMSSPHADTGYVYDSASRLVSLTDTVAGTVSFGYGHGGLTQVQLPNGVDTAYSYDLGGRLERIEHASTAGIIEFFDYALDPNGNPTAVTSTEGTETYGLDDLDRLVAVAYPDGTSEAFGYSPAGDRTSHTRRDGTTATSTYEPPGRLEALTDPTGTTTFAWDGNGNLTGTSDGDSYAWTSRNMMVSANVAGVEQTYDYDATGVRVGVDGDDWLWDTLAGLPELLHDGTSSFLPGLATTSGSDTTWHHTDRLGSTRTLTDATGGVAGTASYTAYGEPRTTTGTLGAQGYTGQYADSTGLIHLRARQYQPRFGALVSEDSVQPNGFGTQGLNLYSYAGTRPTTPIDPSGNVAIVEYAGRVSQLGQAYSDSSRATIDWGQALRDCGTAASYYVTLGLGGAAWLAWWFKPRPAIAEQLVLQWLSWYFGGSGVGFAGLIGLTCVLGAAQGQGPGL